MLVLVLYLLSEGDEVGDEQGALGDAGEVERPVGVLAGARGPLGRVQRERARHAAVVVRRAVEEAHHVLGQRRSVYARQQLPQAQATGR